VGNSRVEKLNSALEAGKLHHGVGNLPHPQGHETLVESGHALLLVHAWKCFAQCAAEARGGLDLDLCTWFQRKLLSGILFFCQLFLMEVAVFFSFTNVANSSNFYLSGLHGAEGNIGEELGASRCGQVQPSSVGVRVLLSDNSRVEHFEDLIQSKLAQTLWKTFFFRKLQLTGLSGFLYLSRVAEEGWGPALSQSTHTILSQCDLDIALMIQKFFKFRSYSLIP
jgi:hypothetical protein